MFLNTHMKKIVPCIKLLILIALFHTNFSKTVFMNEYFF